VIKDFVALFKEAKKKGPKRIAIAYPHDDASIEAASLAEKEGLGLPIFIGDKDNLGKLTKIGKIVDAKDKADAIRKACTLVRKGEADILMKGHTSTSMFLKGVLDKEIGLTAGKTLSHVAVLESPYYHKLLLFTDGGINIRPDLRTKIDILINAINFATSLGITCPKIAVLAAAETVNPDMQETLDAACLAKMGERGQLGKCIIDGPLALDLAVSKEACKAKGIESKVGGDADILLTPDIASCNISAKCLHWLGEAKIGGIVLGAQKPCVMLSRADTKEEKLNSIALGVLSS
jgi:phosphate butyryltransferase